MNRTADNLSPLFQAIKKGLWFQQIMTNARKGRRFLNKEKRKHLLGRLQDNPGDNLKVQTKNLFLNLRHRRCFLLKRKFEEWKIKKTKLNFEFVQTRTGNRQFHIKLHSFEAFFIFKINLNF